MKDRHLRILIFLPAIVFLIFAGCSGGGGSLTNTIANVTGSITSSLAGPTDPTQVAMVEFVPRNQFGRANSPASLGFPSLDGGEMSTFVRGMTRLNTDFTPGEGLGPVFNQRVCLGCHQAQRTDMGLVATAVSRAQRGSAFTVFGDFSPAAGTFNPLTEFGGPFLRERAVNGAPVQIMLPEEVDPNILNAGAVRAIGLRAAPPYIGRGLMEAVPNAEITRYDDPFDADGDGISGRHNENHEDIAFVGGSPVNRLARFGVKGGGTTLLAFMLGGLCFQIGITNPFCPTDSVPPNVAAAGSFDPVPDPEITERVVFDLRSFIRMIPPPALAPLTPSAQLGAQRFGVMLDGAGQPTPGPNGNGIAANRGVNCVGCHVPFMTTGVSPAEVGGRHLSHKTFPIFADMLLHDMGAGLADNVRIGAVTGLAVSREWRTPPLMGLGLIGPPFFHDARVGTAGQTFDESVRQAILLHDGNGADTDSEAHPSIQLFRQLPANEQQGVIDFLRSL